jgi:Ca2+-binding EF-hand superfamily protein
MRQPGVPLSDRAEQTGDVFACGFNSLGSDSMSRSKELFAAVLGICAAGAVIAQATPSFESLDKNKDGQISIQEATEHDDLFVAFKKLDTNKDGNLSREEFEQYKK